MTEINNLIGPKPPEVTTPRFPTPWSSVDGWIYDANGGGIARVETDTNEVPNSRNERTRVAEFIVEAVNHKIESDARTARMRAAFDLDRDSAPALDEDVDNLPRG